MFAGASHRRRLILFIEMEDDLDIGSRPEAMSLF